MKFLDVMIGVVLGVGFQWWSELNEIWMYVAFIFIYIDLVDYWIDYYPSLQKFPPLKEIDFILDVGIIFAMFLYIYSASISIVYLMSAFALFRFFDWLWLLRAKRDHDLKGSDLVYVNTWIRFNIIEILLPLVLILASRKIESLYVLIIFIAIRLLLRFTASLNYKKVYLT